ncbi:MAG TPA: hypothetical protein VLU47_02810, partial [Blastocatellia bacterium]|nr:hypothetical protein [Blastocatellia bacterium]
VVKPDIGRTTSQFIHRGQFFAGRSEVDRVLLREIFEMRSASEHLNSLKDLLDEPNPHDREKLIALRVFQSEILAGAIYRHLLTDADLLRSFRDDEGISMVWGKRDDELVRMWGAPLDLEKSVEWKFDMYLSRRGTG